MGLSEIPQFANGTGNTARDIALASGVIHTTLIGGCDTIQGLRWLMFQNEKLVMCLQVDEPL